MSINIMRVKRKCLDLLVRIEQQGAYTHLVLQRVAESGEVSAEEYPVLLQLVRGTLQQKGVLEEKLEELLPKGLQSLPLDIQLILRVSAYQILFLDRVKKRDTVFEAVELVKHGRYKGFAGLVNAVLRKIDPAHSADTDEQGLLSTRNFPRWLIDRWVQQHGQREVEQFCAASSVGIPLYCRVHTARVSRSDLQAILAEQGVTSEKATFSCNSLKITHIPATVRLTELTSYQEGLFFIQDVSSTIVADIATMYRPHRARDLCAAPGGKTCSMAISIAKHGGVVNSSDRTPERVGLIREAVRRLGLTNVELGELDLVTARPGDVQCELYEAVLLDVPCSGVGTVGRKIDVRWSVSEQGIAELVGLQGVLIREAAQYVKRGGVLVYSTCSIDRAENEEVVDRFLASVGDFEKVDLAGLLPKDVCTDAGYFRSWPHRHEMMGAFAAMMRRV